jgi:peroxiredoxin Q/BCP
MQLRRYSLLRTITTLFVLFVVMACSQDIEKIVELNVGDKAPEFSATDDQGNVWHSKDVLGKKMLVVYFYAAAMTGG